LFRDHELIAVSCQCASADGIARHHIAERIYRTPCCRAKYLEAVGFGESVEIISYCLREVEATSELYFVLSISAVKVAQGKFVGLLLYAVCMCEMAFVVISYDI
jgi:hypothetical protein